MSPNDGITKETGTQTQDIMSNPLLAGKVQIANEVREKIILNPMTIEQLTNLLESEEGLKYFEGKKKELQCMDGRINGGDGMAGSGVLLDRDKNGLPIAKYMKIFQQRVAEKKLEKVCWHKDCGAARLYLKLHGDKAPKSEEVDAEAEDFSTRFAEHLGIPVKETKNEFEKHDEQGIYIDSTDRFNEVPANAKQLPNGFVLSPLYTNDFKYHLTEIEVAIGIAFGDHGAGADAFSPESPFFIMLIKDPKNSKYFGKFDKDISEMIKSKFPQFADKIRIKSINPQIK
jgi:hypothetical protein